MVQIETKLFSIDKLGIDQGKCIHAYKGFYKKTIATVGDKILISIRKRTSTKSATKKKTNEALLAHANVYSRRLSGNYYRFDKNTFLTLHADGSYRGKNIRKALPRELFFSALKDAGFLTVALF